MLLLLDGNPQFMVVLFISKLMLKRSAAAQIRYSRTGRPARPPHHLARGPHEAVRHQACTCMANEAESTEFLNFAAGRPRGLVAPATILCDTLLANPRLANLRSMCEPSCSTRV